AFETGTNQWRRLQSWPAGHGTPLYLQGGLKLGSTAPKNNDAAYDEYVSDPSKPVPYIARPVYADGRAWRTWLVSDQREASGRPDVLAYVTDPLIAPLKI